MVQIRQLINKLHSRTQKIEHKQQWLSKQTKLKLKQTLKNTQKMNKRISSVLMELDKVIDFF